MKLRHTTCSNLEKYRAGIPINGNALMALREKGLIDEGQTRKAKAPEATLSKCELEKVWK
jgi:hypothetical protein